MRSALGFAEVRAVALGFPEVEATRRYDGSPVLEAGGCFMAGLATHESAEPESVVVRIDPEQRRYLLEEAPDIYYLTDPYGKCPVVLVRLGSLGRDALRDLLAMAWRATMAKTGKSRPKASRI